MEYRMKIAGLERDASFVTTEIVFERITDEKAE